MNAQLWMHFICIFAQTLSSEYVLFDINVAHMPHVVLHRWIHNLIYM